MKKLQLRVGIDRAMRFLCGAMAVFLAGLLLLLLGYVIQEGARSLRPTFFLHLPTPIGIPGGGMGNAVLGSLLMVTLASLLGLPVAILCGVYLSECGATPLAQVVRFLAEVLNGIPTIVFGMVAYALVVVPLHTFSAYAGAAALAMILVPLVARTTEVAVRQVPRSWKEASIALGATPARTLLKVVLPGAKAGIVTGAILGIARIAGETAPLLFTALGNDVSWPTHPNRPTAALPLQVFNYATSPYEEWKNQAWVGAFVLVAGVLLLNMLVRFFARTSVIQSSRM